MFPTLSCAFFRLTSLHAYYLADTSSIIPYYITTNPPPTREVLQDRGYTYSNLPHLTSNQDQKTTTQNVIHHPLNPHNLHDGSSDHHDGLHQPLRNPPLGPGLRRLLQRRAQGRDGVVLQGRARDRVLRRLRAVLRRGGADGLGPAGLPLQADGGGVPGRVLQRGEQRLRHGGGDGDGGDPGYGERERCR